MGGIYKMSKVKLHLVSHVHWDPMWYLPYEAYRIRLVKLMKKLLKILDQDDEYLYFMFDGQISAIDDYLKLFPNDEEKIKKHVKSGRLIIGPWYILPEEFMISGESHIRNLCKGHKRGQELGGNMDISYLCDMIGHIPQMPQILQGFNLDTCLAWRGIIDGENLNKTEFIWQSPDGSEVLLKVMPYSYHNLVPADRDGFINKIKEMKKGLIPYATSEYILIMQGGDEQEPLENLPELVKAYNESVGEKEMIQTTLRNHIDSIKKTNSELYRYSGELRSTYQSFILTGVLTTKMEVKLGNERIVRGLEKWTEPFSSVNSILGDEYPEELINHVWDIQLEHSFHDCIYGAHVDSVTKDIINDYKKANEVIDWVTNESLYKISKKINTEGKDINITLFNPTTWKREKEVVTFDIFITGDLLRREFIAENNDGNKLSLDLISVEKMKKYSGYDNNLSASGYHERDGYNYSFSIVVPEMPSLGYINLNVKQIDWSNKEERVQYIKTTKGFDEQTDLKVHNNGCENSYLKVVIKDNGLLNIYDKKNDHWYMDMHLFEDSGDAGDNYNFSPPVENKIITNSGQKVKISLLKAGNTAITYRVELNLEVPSCVIDDRARSKEMVNNKIVSDITLKSQAKTIEFKTIIENNANDHRIRLLFPTGIITKKVFSGSQFYVMERPIGRNDVEDYAEKQWGNYPHRLFVDLNDGNKGVSFFDRGLPEYETTDDGDLYISLLRSTGYLSKNNLPERSYHHAGPELATPLAQEIGKHQFEYSLYFHKKGWQQAKCHQYSASFYAPVKAVQGDSHQGELSAGLSFLEIDNDNLILSAFKKGEREDEWIIRVYNILDEEIKSSISLFKKIKEIYQTNLLEERQSKLELDQDNSFKVTLKPHEIYTVSIIL